MTQSRMSSSVVKERFMVGEDRVGGGGRTGFYVVFGVSWVNVEVSAWG